MQTVERSLKRYREGTPEQQAALLNDPTAGAILRIAAAREGRLFPRTRER